MSPLGPVVISNWKHGRQAVMAGIDRLRQGGSALDAVEYGIRAVEDDETTDSVGLGGLPNFEGVGELDASVMVGNTLEAGAVTCLTRIKNPISVARKVMEFCPHVMMAGDGARRFAVAQGFAESEQVTPRAMEKWASLKRQLLASLSDASRVDAYNQAVGYDSNVVALAAGIEMMIRSGSIRELGTVGTLCLDSRGMMVAGTSTSGLALRLPGRVADSSVIGAGTYATSYGASSSTGLGEYAIRHSLTRSACDLLGQGYPPTEACEEALKRMLRAEDVPYILALIALDKYGRVGGAVTKDRPSFTYQYQRLSDSEMIEVTPTPVSL